MNDFLHRLVSRHTGEAPTVRPRPVSRFESPEGNVSLFLPSEPVAGEDRSPAADAAPPARPPTDRRDRPEEDRPPRSLPRKEVENRFPEDPRERSTPFDWPQAEDHRPSLLDSPSSDRPEPDQKAPGRTPRVASNRQHTTVLREEGTREAGPRRQLLADAPLAGFEDKPRLLSEPSDLNTAPSADDGPPRSRSQPDPMVRDRYLPPRAPVLPTRRDGVGSPGERTEAPPSVTIHIGRIELRSAPGETKGKKKGKAKSRTPAMTLEQYLNKRNAK